MFVWTSVHLYFKFVFKLFFMIKKYVDFFNSIGKKLILTDDAINYIVDRASGMDMGARALKSIVETAMVNILFNLDGIKGNSLTLTRDDIEEVFNKKETVISNKEDILKKSNINIAKKDDKNYMAWFYFIYIFLLYIVWIIESKTR
mgnify:CR=1 FL=1